MSRLSRLLPLVLMWALLGNFAALGQELMQLEEEAIRAAVDRVAPAVVGIETVGGLDRVGQVLIGSGPTTGLVVSSDGYVVSSAFNFVQKPTSILLKLADGSRLPARLVATDYSRMLTILKVEPERELATPEAAPAAEVHVGQWAIAIGRTFEGPRTNLSVGIVSALSRVWGKALQTDAKVSPANYGGPLVDIQGRVLGVLVPLSPDKTGEVSGAEWYDSGIGFAIPLEHVLKILPRLKEGHDLRPGILGVSLKGRNMFADAADVAVVRPNSPAYKAGFQRGDRVVAVDGQPIARLVELRTALNPRYAGEQVRVAVQRGDERFEREVELVAELRPYQHPFLGLLPLRDADAKGQALAIRYVYPEGPAANAGLAAGDELVELAGSPVSTAAAALEKLNAAEAGQTIAIAFRRGDELLRREVTLAPLPEAIPAELPPAHPALGATPGDRPVVGKSNLKVAEFANDCLVYVPESYDPRIAYGFVIYLAGQGSPTEDELVARWRPLCERFDLILLAPKPADPAGWQPTELEFLKKAIEQAAATYSVDRQRIVAHGAGAAGVLAYVLAFANQDLIRGVAVVNAPPPRGVPDNDPLYRQAFYSAASKRSRIARQVSAAVEQLRSMKYPVTVRDLGDDERDLTADELVELARWIDSLDRL